MVFRTVVLASLAASAAAFAPASVVRQFAKDMKRSI
jgi:hypothetical protein